MKRFYLASILAPMMFGMMSGCKDKSKDDGPSPARVGGDGVYSSTYYDSSTKFSLTVPDDWNIYADTNGAAFSGESGNLDGRVDTSTRGLPYFLDDVTNLQNQVQNGADSYTPIGSQPTTVDGETAYRIECRLVPSSQWVELHEVIVYIDKGTVIVVITFKTPQAVWTAQIQNTVDEVIEEVRRQDSIMGALRRALNQAEFGSEAELGAFYLEQFSDSALEQDGVA